MSVFLELSNFIKLLYKRTDDDCSLHCTQSSVLNLVIVKYSVIIDIT